MKKFISLSLALIMLLFCLPVGAAEGREEEPAPSDIRVLLNGSYLEFDQQPIILEGSTLVPLRKIFESFGMDIAWDEKTATVTATKAKTEFTIKIGESFAIVNGKEVPLALPARIVGGRTLLPLRFISDSVGAKTSWDGVNATAIITFEPKEGEVADFNLGKGLLNTSMGEAVEYEMIGGISVPKSDNNPLVFLLHGRNQAEPVNETRYDMGLSYLMKELSANGYLAIALNVNMQMTFDFGEPVAYERLTQMVEAQIAKLEKAEKGEDVGFGVDLKGKINLDSISLIGHSIGGQGAIFVGRALENEGRKVSAILSVAPSLQQIMEKSDYPDAPTATVIPQYDDDVIGLDGQNFFDGFAKIPAAFSHLVYLYGAEHNPFNEALTGSGPSPVPEADRFHAGISPEKQRGFYKNYAIDFLNFTQGRAGDSKTFLVGSAAGGSLYGADVRTSLKTPDSKTVITPDGKYSASGAAAKFVIAKSFPDETTAGVFNPPGVGRVELLNILWEKRGGSVKIPLSCDASDFAAIDIKVAQDSSNPLNGGADQTFSIGLRDKSGAFQTVVFEAGTPALSYQAGRLESYKNDDGKEVSFWVGNNPLSSLRVQLSAFDKLDLKNLSELEIILDKTDSGSLMISTAELMK